MFDSLDIPTLAEEALPSKQFAIAIVVHHASKRFRLGQAIGEAIWKDRGFVGRAKFVPSAGVRDPERTA